MKPTDVESIVLFSFYPFWYQETPSRRCIDDQSSQKQTRKNKRKMLYSVTTLTSKIPFSATSSLTTLSPTSLSTPKIIKASF